MINIKKINNRVGETTINNQGFKMTILNYRKNNDIDVVFEDGYISMNKSYYSFLKGSIKNSNSKRLRTNRIGCKNINIQGLNMTIIKYNGSNDCTVQFEDGYVKSGVTYDNFKKGVVNNPNYKKVIHRSNNGVVSGVGITDDITIDNNYNTLKSYSVWRSMINRCYKNDDKYKNYIDCSVCDEWKRYSNFKKWFDKNYYVIEGETMQLDKDIIKKGNKIYSPENCIIAPLAINTIFAYNKKKKIKNKLLGVEFVGNKYRARMHTKDNKVINLGLFDTKEEAFIKYKYAKENYIKEVADTYKDKIPNKLYNAMYRWEVDIND